jgi:hypothetical protein
VRLDREPEVIRVASELRAVDQGNGPVQAVIDYCCEKARRLIGGLKISSLAEFEQVICSRLKLVFETIYDDRDLDVVAEKYRRLGEIAFLRIKTTFDPATFAILMERRNINGRSPDRYVAVIDCRGEKAHRAYFSRWHEIAHLLTLKRQLELPFYRSTGTTPSEKLMDSVAGELAFFAPLFGPVLEKHIRANGLLSFGVVDAVRWDACPESSYQAALFACLRQTPTAALLLDVGLGLTSAEKKLVESKSLPLFPVKAPEPRLRVLTANSSASARATDFRVHRNMHVPAESIVSQHYEDTKDSPIDTGAAGLEDFSIWRHSDGRSVGEGQIRVEARRFGNQFLALITRP